MPIGHKKETQTACGYGKSKIRQKHCLTVFWRFLVKAKPESQMRLSQLAVQLAGLEQPRYLISSKDQMMTGKWNLYQTRSLQRRLIMGVVMLMLIATLIKEYQLMNWLLPNYDATRLPYMDKVGHFLGAGLITFLLNVYFNFPHFKVGRWVLPKVSLGIALLSTLDELSQYWRPYRSLDLLDGTANLLGVAVFSWLAWRYYQQQRRANA